jgi:type IV secretory pathway protease TraF
LLKQTAGLPGDEICRTGTHILINGSVVGDARVQDSLGRDLPSWEGCVVLGQDQLFLMNAHPDSLDGRYFGVTDRRDIVAVASLILTWR